MVGLVGGVLVGLAEPLARMASVGEWMTVALWLEALSFSAVSQVVVWVVVCTAACLLAGQVARRRAAWRAGYRSGSSALAAFVVGGGIATTWALAAGRGVSLVTGPLGVIAAFGVGSALMLPATWLANRLAATRVGRLSRAMGQVAVVPALIVVAASVVVQWQGRSRLRSAEGFWPRTASTPTTRATDRPPDVVLIVFDALRLDRLGCYGYGRPTSPHVDAFASDAVVYENAISPGVWTEPAHASIFTGLFRSQHGVGWNRVWLDDGFVTLAEALRDRGYQTLALSNNPNVSPGTNLTQGFEQFAEPYRLSFTTNGTLYAFAKQVWTQGGALGWLGRWFVYDAGGRATASLAAKLLHRRDRTRPLLLFVNYMESHSPYEPRRAYRERFVKAGDLGRSYRVDQSLKRIFEYILRNRSVYTQRDLEIRSDLYDARVREMDDCFAEMIDVLAAELDLDNTVVILTADHGENLGDHELLDHQFCVYDTLVHVPLIVRWPRALRPQRVERLVQTHDLFPTLLGWAGAEATQSVKMMARSLAAALDASTETVYRNAYAEYLSPPKWAFKMAQRSDPSFDQGPWMVAFRAVYDQQWKLIRRSDRKVELYDRSKDPGERDNLAGPQRSRVDRLKRRLGSWRRSFEPFDPSRFTGPTGHRLDEGQKRRLRDLGYVQ